MKLNFNEPWSVKKSFIKLNYHTHKINFMFPKLIYIEDLEGFFCGYKRNIWTWIFLRKRGMLMLIKVFLIYNNRDFISKLVPKKLD